jgi:hypothetical protein
LLSSLDEPASAADAFSSEDDWLVDELPLSGEELLLASEAEDEVSALAK